MRKIKSIGKLIFLTILWSSCMCLALVIIGLVLTELQEMFGDIVTLIPPIALVVYLCGFLAYTHLKDKGEFK